MDKHSDLSRLSRYLTNTQIAVIFGGGGSRGFSHAAIIKRIRHDLDIPVDIVGGTSIGAIAGAYYAKEKNYEHVYQGLKYWANAMGNKFTMASDLTFPYVSFFSSKVYINEMQYRYGYDTQIEDLWLPYFCITTDISANQIRVHNHGHVWRWTVASRHLKRALLLLFLEGPS